MQTTRTNKAIKNVSVTTICQITYIIVNFICRTVFTKVLGAEYLGLNGLFSNILTMLSFVELGMGSALVYKMYKPLAEHDEHMLCVYLQFYKKIYRVIAIVVAALGICVIPFLKYIVDIPKIEINIKLLYLLFLMDTVISYLYVYKKSILIADQKNYVVAVYTQIFNVIMNIGQIIILLITHNFIHYLIFKIICDWLNNVLCSKRAEREYPYINNKVNESIPECDKEELKEDIKGLLLSKIASVAFDGTDNIFISAFVGVTSVGIVSNYTLILTTINSLLNQVFYSLTASIGNLGVNAEKHVVRNVLRRIYFVNALLYGYLFAGMVILLKMFVMDIWVGEEYYLPQFTIVLLVVELCLRGMHYPVYMTRTALGMFHQKKFIPPVCAILNIGLDFILGLNFGIAGIITATIISRFVTRAIDIQVLYKEYFKISSFTYYNYHLKFLLFIVVCTVMAYFSVSAFVIKPVVLRFIVEIIVVSIIYWGSAWLWFRKTSEFEYCYGIIRNNLFGKR